MYPWTGKIPTSMTLNDLERLNRPYFSFFSPNLIALLANYAYVTVIEDRPIMSAKYCLSLFQSSTFAEN